MDVLQDEQSHAIVIDLEGRFHEETVARQRDVLETIAADDAGDVYLDLSRVTSIDSSGVGIIAFLFKRLATKRRRLFLVGVNGQPKRLLEFLRIDRVIDIRDSLPIGGDQRGAGRRGERAGPTLEEVA